MPLQRLLLVEDEFLIRMMLSESLTDAGYEVLEASDADAALQLVGEHPDLDMLLTDIQLAGPVDGIELARRVRETIPELPVIYMSGRPDAGPRSDPRREQVIAKPYLPSEVRLAVERMLAAT